MKRIIISLIISLLLFMNASFSLATGEGDYVGPGVGMKETLDEVNKGNVKKLAGGTADSIPVLIGEIIGIVLSFVGVIFFVLIIYAGLMWMTASGNDERIQKSINIIQTAVIGLILVLSAYAIISYIGSILT